MLEDMVRRHGLEPHCAVEAAVGVPVLDGVACAVKLVEGLVDYGLSTSRVAAYEEPEPKELVGYPELAAR
jgi:allantoin racemase